MSASSAPSRSACGFGFVLAVCASCATYVDGTAAPRSSGGAGAGVGGAGAGGFAPHQGGGGGQSGGDAGTSGSMSQGGKVMEAGGEAGEGGASGLGQGGSGGGGAGAGGQGGANGGTAGAGGKAGNGGGAGKAGGGAGGSGGVPCAQNPIPPKPGWTVTASHSRPGGLDPVANTKDGITTNRWSSGKDQSGNEWLQIDFGASVRLSKFTLILGANPDDYPRTYAARLSGSSQNTAAPVLASGMGAEGADTEINLPTGSVGRYLLISQGGMATDLWWSVAEVQAECVD